MKIRTPLKFYAGSTRIKYPTPEGEWRDTIIDGNVIIGECSSQLFLFDGVTKAFDWELYEQQPIYYGQTISSLAFFDRMLPEEETYLREQAKTNVHFERLLSRIERLASEVVLTRDDVKTGVDFVLSEMVGNNIAGYTMHHIAERKQAIFAPATWDELPTRLQSAYPTP